jgi:hypothetical protein
VRQEEWAGIFGPHCRKKRNPVPMVTEPPIVPTDRPVSKSLLPSKDDTANVFGSRSRKKRTEITGSSEAMSDLLMGPNLQYPHNLPPACPMQDYSFLYSANNSLDNKTAGLPTSVREAHIYAKRCPTNRQASSIFSDLLYGAE